MKILLIHHRLPWPLDNGMDKLRFNLIRTLSYKYDLTLVLPASDKPDPIGVNEIKKYVKDLNIIQVKDLRDNSIFFYFKRTLNLLLFKRPYYLSDCYSETFNRQLKVFIAKYSFDFIHFLSDFSGQYMLSPISRSKIIVGPVDDVVQTLYERFIASGKLKIKVITFLNYLITKHFFSKILKANIVYFHSSEDLIRVNNRLKYETNSCVLPVATELEDDLSSLSDYSVEEKSLVFIGGMGVSFNQDAVLNFYWNILPKIRSKVPNVKFYIVGNSPSRDILELDNGGSVIVTGAVDNVGFYIQKGSVYVSPMRKGTGIKTKMIEAIKAGKAIVATTKALQGLWEIDNEAIRIENNSEDFANAVIEILNNNGLRLQMEKKARQLYETYYSFPKVAPITLKIYSENLYKYL